MACGFESGVEVLAIFIYGTMFVRLSVSIGSLGYGYKHLVQAVPFMITIYLKLND